MALISPHAKRLFVNNNRCPIGKGHGRSSAVSFRGTARFSSMEIDASHSSHSDDQATIKWGSSCLQGRRDEMEDAIVLHEDALDGYSFAAVLDGHGGSASVEFLREELFKGFAEVFPKESRLSGKDFESLSASLTEAFASVDKRLLNKLDNGSVDDGSGSTATVLLIDYNTLYISHIGDSSMVLSSSGKPKSLTVPHRPFGSSKSSVEEAKRIRNAGGWITNGRICGDIAVSRAFGDIRFKTRKNDMLQKGVDEGRWPKKFASRVKFNDDLVVAKPDNTHVSLDNNSEFIVLATDGLWDYVSSSETVTFVRNQFQEHGDVQIACEKLAEAALNRGSQDNISVIIADLGRTNWESAPVQTDGSFFGQLQAFASVGAVLILVWMTSQLSH